MALRPPTPPTPPALALLAGAALAGCAGGSDRAAPPSPGHISHVVLFVLKDPADAPALVDDCRKLARVVPGVVTAASGPPFDSGRSTVDGGYDVGFVIGFDSTASLAGYATHPAHESLVAKWRPRVRSMRVFDVLDASVEGARAPR